MTAEPCSKFCLNISVFWVKKTLFQILNFFGHFLSDRFNSKPPSQTNIYKVTPGDPILSEPILGETSKFVVAFCLFWPKGVEDNLYKMEGDL